MNIDYTPLIEALAEKNKNSDSLEVHQQIEILQQIIRNDDFIDLARRLLRKEILPDTLEWRLVAKTDWEAFLQWQLTRAQDTPEKTNIKSDSDEKTYRIGIFNPDYE